jgi:hypothetical protein
MELLTDHRSETENLCRAYNVSVLYVFGSIVGTKFDAECDIDFVVAFDNVPWDDYYADNYLDLCEALEKLLGRKIDLVVETSIKNPYFKEEVDETKQLLFAA